MAEPNQSAGKISADRLVELTGLTDRRHRQLAAEGFFPPPVKGEYVAQATIKGLFKYFREQLHGSGRASIASEKLRKVKEEADRIALENDKTRGSLVEVEAVYKHFEKIFVAFRARVLSSQLTDEEKDEILNDLRRLKARDVSNPDSPGRDTQSALPDSTATAAP